MFRDEDHMVTGVDNEMPEMGPLSGVEANV
jgi:hypothetical protein